MSRLRDNLIRWEGLSLRPYRDTNGYLTVGFGRNLDTTGISMSEAYGLLDNDIERCMIAAGKNFPWYADLTPARQDVILAMIFQLGIGMTLQFHRFLGAMEIANYAEAANQLRQSLWAKQTPKRVRELALLLECGEYGAYPTA